MKIKKTNTDVIIENLKKANINKEDGNLINSKEDKSFSNINTTLYGQEVDVDDL